MINSSEIPINNLTMYFEEAGRGDALVLLHGSMSSSAVWQPYIGRFSAQQRVIVPDLRDHGRTTFTADFDPALADERVADDVIALLDVLDIDRAILCGWSGGGDTALHVARHHPDRVRALIIGGVTLRVTDAARAILQAMGLDGPGEVNLSRAEQVIPDLLALWQQTHAQTPDHWLRLMERQSHAMLNPPELSAEALAAVETETLIIWGDRDQFLPVEDAVELYRALPNALLAIIPNADHFVTSTHEAQFGRTVADFLALLET